MRALVMMMIIAVLATDASAQGRRDCAGHTTGLCRFAVEAAPTLTGLQKLRVFLEAKQKAAEDPIIAKVRNCKGTACNTLRAQQQAIVDDFAPQIVAVDRAQAAYRRGFERLCFEWAKEPKNAEAYCETAAVEDTAPIGEAVDAFMTRR